MDSFSFDDWFEEGEWIVGHAPDPFKRIDVRTSSRQARVGVDGQVSAESSRPMLLFETGPSTRCCLAREDGRTDFAAADDDAVGGQHEMPTGGH